MKSESIPAYTKNIRFFEILGLILFFPLWLYQIYQVQLISLLFFILILFTSLLLADFLSGIAHWAADTWGTVSWFIIGPTFIRSFREHHAAPDEIIKHDFIETNGATALVLLPVLILNSKSYSLFWLLTCMWLLLTNQFHKMAHKNQSLFLTSTQHKKHHLGAFTSHYCITCGWMNPFLDRIQFFRYLENLITKMTNAQPRAEDGIVDV